MRNKICCCFGHKDIFENIYYLSSVVEDLVLKEKITVFMTGGIGEFDIQFAAAVRSVKIKYPYIKLLLIKPYFSNELNVNKS